MTIDAREKAPPWIHLLIQALIVYSIVTAALETMPELAAYGTFFKISEAVVVAIFTAEYLAFWALSDQRLKYPTRFMSIIDLLAILPFYVEAGVDLRALRALRLLRIFRVLRIGRYSRAMRTLGEAASRVGPELVAFGFIVLVVLIISAMALYYAEHDAQPTVYASVPASFWWAVVTLTTVGYGDVYPITIVGKVVAGVVMLIGISLVAVPTGLLSSTMTEMLRERRLREGDER